MFIAPIDTPEQIDCVAGVTFAVGIGSTMTLATDTVDAHPFCDVATSVNTAVCWIAVLLVSVPEIVWPTPAAATPVRFTVLLRDQA